MSKKDGTVSTEKECPGTTSYTYVNLVHDFLFIKNASNDYYVCRFDNQSALLFNKLDTSAFSSATSFWL